MRTQTLFEAPDMQAQTAAHQAIERAKAKPNKDLAPVPVFDDFWAVWPKREAKKDARRAWDKLSVASRTAALAALPAHVARWRREGRARNHIPHPATWLNGERWEDELGEIFAPRPAGGRPGFGQPVPEAQKPWPCTWAGIVQKGAELGLQQRSDELAPYFRARVYEAAGLTAADRARIKADWGVDI